MNKSQQIGKSRSSREQFHEGGLTVGDIPSLKTVSNMIIWRFAGYHIDHVISIQSNKNFFPYMKSNNLRLQTAGSPVHSPFAVHFLILDPSSLNPIAQENSTLWGYWNSSPFLYPFKGVPGSGQLLAAHLRSGPNHWATCFLFNKHFAIGSSLFENLWYPVTQE